MSKPLPLRTKQYQMGFETVLKRRVVFRQEILPRGGKGRGGAAHGAKAPGGDLYQREQQPGLGRLGLSASGGPNQIHSFKTAIYH